MVKLDQVTSTKWLKTIPTPKLNVLSSKLSRDTSF